MRLKPDQLSSHLQTGDLSPVYYLSGDEPLQMLEAVDLIRSHARAAGFEERYVFNVDRVFDWDQIHRVGMNLSLFSSKKIIEIRLAQYKPGREGGASLIEYCDAISQDSLLLITGDKIDKSAQNTKWFKTLEKTGAILQIWPVDTPRLPNWIVSRAKRQGKTMSIEAASLIADKVEGNLLAARQEIEKLCLAINTDHIDVGDVMEAITDSTRFDVFTLIEHALQSRPNQIIRMLRGLKNEGVEPMAVFGPLMWQFRQLCSISIAINNGSPPERVFAEYRVWQQKRPALLSLLRRTDDAQLARLLRKAGWVERAMKGVIKTDPWETLENFMFEIAGIRLQSLPDIA